VVVRRCIEEPLTLQCPARIRVRHINYNHLLLKDNFCTESHLNPTRTGMKIVNDSDY
jgi:hypothetical protein